MTFISAAVEPDLEFNAIGWADGLGIDGQYRGPAGLQTFTEEWTRQMDWPSFELRQYVDFGDRLYLEIVITSTGLASGAQTNRTMGCVAYFASTGRLARMDTYWHAAEARNSCGL